MALRTRYVTDPRDPLVTVYTAPDAAEVPRLMAELVAPVGRTRARYYTEGPGFPSSALEVARTPFSLTSPYSDG